MCGYGVDRQMKIRGRSVSVKVAILSRRDLGDVPCLSYMRENRTGEALKHKSLCTEYPKAARVSGGLACWISLPKYFGGGRVQSTIPRFFTPTGE